MTKKQFEWLKNNQENIHIHQINYRRKGEDKNFWMLWPENVKIEDNYINAFGNHCLGDQSTDYIIKRKYIMQINYI